MQRQDLIDQLSCLEPDLRSAGMKALYLFGSRARGDHRPDSDVDLAYDADEDRFGYFDQFAVHDRIARLLDAPVDLVSRHAIHPRAVPFIEPDLVRIF